MIYFTSDFHMSHSNILKYCPDRPWKTVEEMNEGLIRNWNAVVNPSDSVYFLGDFSLGFPAVEKFTSRLLGEKVLINGNHDFTHAANKKSRTPERQDKWITKYLEAGWDQVLVEWRLLLKNGVMARLNHLPYL
jgi:calcineurin-like phosphoesterase family protein